MKKKFHITINPIKLNRISLVNQSGLNNLFTKMIITKQQINLFNKLSKLQSSPLINIYFSNSKMLIPNNNITSKPNKLIKKNKIIKKHNILQKIDFNMNLVKGIKSNLFNNATLQISTKNYNNNIISNKGNTQQMNQTNIPKSYPRKNPKTLNFPMLTNLGVYSHAFEEGSNFNSKSSRSLYSNINKVIRNRCPKFSDSIKRYKIPRNHSNLRKHINDEILPEFPLKARPKFLSQKVQTENDYYKKQSIKNNKTYIDFDSKISGINDEINNSDSSNDIENSKELEKIINKSSRKYYIKKREKKSMTNRNDFILLNSLYKVKDYRNEHDNANSRTSRYTQIKKDIVEKIKQFNLENSLKFDNNLLKKTTVLWNNHNI